MKLLVMAMCFAYVPTFAQDRSPQVITFGQVKRAIERKAQYQQIVMAIEAAQPFRLPSSYLLSVTATSSMDDGHVLTLTAVKITMDSVVVTADELVYDWDTHQIEPRGNVHLTPTL